MKSKILFLGAIGAGSLAVAACHHNDDNNSSPTPPPTANVQQLDTAQVLALAQVTSETSSPFPVNGGELVLTDTSETTSPIAVNAQ